MANELADPLTLLRLFDQPISELVTKDGALVLGLMNVAVGNIRGASQARRETARTALMEWSQQYLGPRFRRFQGWATELGVENYEKARLAAVGPDSTFVLQSFDRGPGAEAFMAWLQSLPTPPASPDDLAAAIHEGAQLRTVGAYNDTMTRNSLRDPASRGWTRVAEPGACAFCLMLASRGSYGILYRSEKTANFRAHSPRKSGGGLCRCHALPAFEAATKVRPLGATPDYATNSPYAAYAKDAQVFLDANGAIGLVAA